MIRRPPRSTLSSSSAASDVYKRQRRIHLQDLRRPEGTCNRRNIADEVEAKVVVEGRVDRISHSHREERVAIGGRPNDRVGSNIAASPRSVVNDDLLPEPSD